MSTDHAPYDATAKQKAQAKTARIPIKVVAAETLKKPDWIRVRAGSPTTRFYEIKQILREHNLHTVCEEASCPNIGECFGKGTATFMIMGDKCTRRCPFCDVGHGRPDPLDADEPANLARTIAALKLKYVVITSVDRDDLRDHDVDMLTIGQYLQPSEHHLPVRSYVHPDTFKMYEEEAYKMGFTHAAVGAMVRSSYHADLQAHGAGVV